VAVWAHICTRGKKVCSASLSMRSAPSSLGVKTRALALKCTGTNLWSMVLFGVDYWVTE